MAADLNDSLIFVKVVEQGTFTGAARALGLPKTTVSRKVQALEDRLGARLLNRTTRRHSLTEAGAVYFEHCKQIAGRLDEAEDAVHQLEGSPRGWLRITAPHSLSDTLLAPIFVRFRHRYPEVKLDLHLSNDRLDLVANEIDVAVRIGELPDSSLVARPLASWGKFVYAGTEYLTRYGEPLVPEDLEHHQTLYSRAPDRGPRYTWTLGDGRQEREFEVHPVMVANDPQSLLPLLAAGQGLMLASDLMVYCQLNGRGVRRVLANWKAPDTQLTALFQGGRVLSPKVRAFVDFVAESLQSQCQAACKVRTASETSHGCRVVA